MDLGVIFQMKRTLPPLVKRVKKTRAKITQARELPPMRRMTHPKRTSKTLNLLPKRALKALALVQKRDPNALGFR